MTATRRQRFTLPIVGAVVLALVAIGAIALASGDEPPAQRPSGNQSATADLPDADVDQVETADAWAYPSTHRGGELLASAVGERGESVVSHRFTLSTVDLRWDYFCAADGGRDFDRWAQLTMNGQSMGGSSCGEGERPGPVGHSKLGTAEQGERLWARMGIRAGDDVVVRIRLTDRDGKAIRDPEARLGFALYERVRRGRDPDRFVDVRGVGVPREQRLDGRVYALDFHRSMTLEPEGNHLRVQVPAGTGSPYAPYVGYGLLYPDGRRGPQVNIQLQVDGQGRNTSVAPGLSGTILTDAQTHEASLRVNAPRAAGGVLVIAVYRLSPAA
ncbi:MAG: hypothetical protein M3419_07155 [Actinomycetota bacterium]|nr:hypothetical protein [Actinomycetota bacterium]